MIELEELAEEIGVHERTLRRAANRGAIRVRREGSRRASLAPGEYEYVRTQWPLVGRLVQELRTLPHVRLAVLYGSVARGDDDDRSDVDLLVRFREDGVRPRALVADRLEDAVKRRVQLVSVADAPPLLLADVLRDGLVLVDRDGDWTVLKKNETTIRRRARKADLGLERDAWAVLEELGAA